MRYWSTVVLVAMIAAAIGAQAASAAPKLAPIYSFCSAVLCEDGGNPSSPITIDQAGALYGTTAMQTVNSMVLYKLTPNGSSGYTRSILYTFCYSPNETCPNGTDPQGHIVVDPAGTVYGVTPHGNGPSSQDEGVFYSITAGGQQKVLYRFCPDGAACQSTGTTPLIGLTYFGAESGLPYDGTSPLYGIMYSGGDGNQGTVFRLAQDGQGGWVFTKLLSLTEHPSDLITNTDGSTFLMLTQVSGGGGIYKLKPKGGDVLKQSKLADICTQSQCDAGDNAAAFALNPANGLLAGITTDAAANGKGAVWTAKGPKYKKLKVAYALCSQANCADGYAPPYIGLDKIDTTGIAYGALQLGGNQVGTTGQTGGALFQINAKGKYAPVYKFCSQTNCVDGAVPSVAPTPDGHGNYFGVTIYGGNGKYGSTKKNPVSVGGMIYEFTP